MTVSSRTPQSPGSSWIAGLPDISAAELQEDLMRRSHRESALPDPSVSIFRAQRDGHNKYFEDLLDGCDLLHQGASLTQEVGRLKPRIGPQWDLSSFQSLDRLLHASR
jgi:hypothetical protein